MGAPDARETIVGARIKAARLASDMTQHQLGAQVGLSNVTIWKYENARTCITVGMFFKLADALGVPWNELVPIKGRKGQWT